VIPVVADADTLFGATTRGLLIHLDYLGLIRLHWSAMILDELSRALVDTGRKADAGAAKRHERLLRTSLPNAEVAVTEVQKQFKAVAGAVRSAKDIHVAACAHALVIGSYYPQAQVVNLVTNNVRDFGVRMLADMSIAVARPDSFLIDLHRGNAGGVAAAFAGLRATLRSSPPPEQLLDRLAADGQTQTATALRDAYQHGAAVL
jgi:PIN domain